MPEKVSSKILRLEKSLNEEISRTVELYGTIRSQEILISSLLSCLVESGVSDDKDHALQIARKRIASEENDRQLSFKFS